MPSTISVSVIPFSETPSVTIPVSPTSLKASPINLPRTLSLLVDIVAISSIMSPLTGMLIDSKYLTT